MDSDIGVLNRLRITPLDDDDDDDVEDDQNERTIEMDDDDEEYGDEYGEFATLGFVEKPKNPQFLLRHLFPSKAGGVPAWLIPVNLPSANSRTCGFCREPLQFLLQIYPPINDMESAFHRMLYVFMCPSMSCLLKDQHEQWKRSGENSCRSVKVFRCQLPRSNAFYSSEPPRRDGSDNPLSVGAALCSWCGTWTGEKVCSNCRKARYCSGKHQAMHWCQGHKSDCHQLVTSPEASVSILGNAACKPFWPEYEIGIEDECSYPELSANASSATSMVSVSNKTDGAFQSLFHKFESDNEKKTWVSFQQRIARAPNQVLRYCRDMAAKPLWPLLIGCPSEPDIPRCNCCKGPLAYEFQIMPQLLYYLDVKNDPGCLDWGTIVVYTCLHSCESNISYKEEFAWVQLYPATSTP